MMAIALSLSRPFRLVEGAALISRERTRKVGGTDAALFSAPLHHQKSKSLKKSSIPKKRQRHGHACARKFW
jgi:hypothetical protein